MEITLSDKDIDALAANLEKRITARVVGRLALDPAWDVMSERAKEIALLHIDKDTFAFEAAEQMSKRLQQNGEKLLREIVLDAVHKVRAQDPAMQREIAKGICEAIEAHAARIRAVAEKN